MDYMVHNECSVNTGPAPTKMATSQQPDDRGTIMSRKLQIHDDHKNSSYVAMLDDQVAGVVVYKRFGDRVVIRHTVVEPEFRGGGVGTDMVRAVLDDMRDRREKLTNYCGFVADFIADNTGYQDLVDRGRPGLTLPREKRGKERLAPALYQ
jgi:uncharacterized protein